MPASHIEYLYCLNRYDIKPGLERMQALMEALGHPERKFKSIHISGTNGKGSVAAMVESVLRESGLTTALYTSPDIYSFHERIQVAGKIISDNDLADSIWKLKKIVEVASIPASFFEFTTAVAYDYFARKNIDIAVVEVGMGGRWDATNVITPLVSVITNIGLDHQEFLGDTKEKIATEKSGIIKPHVPIVTGEKIPRILAVIEEYARSQEAPVIKSYEQIQIVKSTTSLEGQQVEISGGMAARLSLPLLGNHQLDNLQVALTTIKVLQTAFPGITHEAITSGIAKTEWEGRLDVIQKDPLILVDGAHNADGVAALVEFMKTVPNKDTLVFGLKEGRDMSPFIPLITMFKRIIVTKGNFMPEDPHLIAKGISHPHVQVEENVDEAINHIHDVQGVTLIAGSLYLVADVLAILRKDQKTSR